MSDRRVFLEQIVGSLGFISVRKPLLGPLLGSLETIKLPNDWFIYECGGQCVFPVYGASGSLTSMSALWLIRHCEDGKDRSIPITITDMELMATNGRGVENIIEWKIRKAIQDTENAVVVNLDGGELPFPRKL